METVTFTLITERPSLDVPFYDPTVIDAIYEKEIALGKIVSTTVTVSDNGLFSTRKVVWNLESTTVDEIGNYAIAHPELGPEIKKSIEYAYQNNLIIHPMTWEINNPTKDYTKYTNSLDITGRF